MTKIPLDDYMAHHIKEWQCAGCATGSDPRECESLNVFADEDMFHCQSHCPGTYLRAPTWGQRIALGLPKGFCKVGPHDLTKLPMVRIWREGARPSWNKLNVAVWKLEQDGTLFVRTFMPRINYAVVDVMPGATLADCPDGIDVAAFLGEID